MTLSVRIARLCIAVPAALVFAAIMGSIILVIGLPLYTLESLFSRRPGRAT